MGEMAYVCRPPSFFLPRTLPSLPSITLPNLCVCRRKFLDSAASRSLVIETVERETAEEPRAANRRLILLRHAESSWEDRSLRDHDRPLSEAGRIAAIDVAHKLQQINWVPELILSSDAARSTETLEIMRKHFQRLSEAEAELYRCVGHNRGWEEAASIFSGASVELKTSNAALLEASGKSWEEAFLSAGLGGWKLIGIVKPEDHAQAHG